jgi:RimJ/RimL family protein N-acetyltransferase
VEPLLIKTERLLIREWQDSDLPAFLRLVRDPEVARWSGPDEGAVPDMPFIPRMHRDQRERGWALWAVELREPGPDDPTGPIGWAGFGTESLPDAELAWTFLSSVWGRGYATEAGIASRDYGFGVLGMPRMVSIVDERNAASACVAEKVGLMRDGSVDCHGVPHMVFDIDVARWRALTGRE